MIEKKHEKTFKNIGRLKRMKLYTLVKNVRNKILSASIILQRIIRFLAEKNVLPEKLWRKLQPIGIFKLRINTQAFLYDSSEEDQLSRNIVWTNFRDWEPMSVSIFYEFSKVSNYVIDIGAYTGIYSLIACTANNYCKVFIFEPNPNMIANIERNCCINNFIDRVKIYNIALSDENGDFEFGITAKDRTASGLITSLNEHQSIDSIIRAEVWKLDDLFDREELNEATLVKIDVEGNELKTLKGMTKIIGYFKPVFLIECLTQKKYIEVENYLRNYGYYNYFHIGSDNLSNISNGYRIETGNTNYLFLPNNKWLSIVSKYLLKDQRKF